MVAGVGVESRGESHAEPEPGNGDMRAEKEGTDGRREQVGEDVLHRVAVEGGETDRGSPLMVLLVDVLVHPLVVEQPVGVVEHHLLHQHTDDQL